MSDSTIAFPLCGNSGGVSLPIKVIDNGDGTFSIGTSASGAATLPTGASTSAKQDTGNASLATIASNTGSASNSFINITSAATTLVKTGAGVLHVVNINSLGTVASTVAIYDGLTAGGTPIATINSLSISGPQIYDVAFTTGLTVVTTGTVAPNVTVAFR